MSQRSTPITSMVDQRAAFFVVWAGVAAAMAFGSILMVGWIWDRVKEKTPTVPQSAIYQNYDPSGAYQKTQAWADAQKAIGTYMQQYPQPQNAQVLKGYTTAQIYAYMQTQVSGGLKVTCQYCHNINNFASDENPQKVKARAMMLMSADLNRNFVSSLPASVGGLQITCATCHNGAAKFETYPAKIQNTLPLDYRLPLDRTYPGGLVVTGRTDIGLDSVALNQYTMYHFNSSLGQGCTFCHNSRYFASNEIAQKTYAVTMLRMATYIHSNYAAPGGDATKGIMGTREVSCWMCHQGARVPPGAAKPGQVPAMLSTTP